MDFTDIDLLYTCGCSMTKMTPIGKHPKEHQQWPALLAEKMGCSIHNDGLWAGNNNRTFRKLREFIKTTTVPLDRVYFIIQITSAARTEAWHGTPLEDYTWQDAPKSYQEKWIRLSPHHIDTEKYDYNDPTVWASARSVHVNPNSLTDHDLLELIRYNYARLNYLAEPNHMQETLLSQVYAIKGLLLEHNLKHTIVIGHEGFDAFNCISDNFSDIPRQAITYMADDHTKVDGMHPDSKGSIIIADKLFDFITDHTDK